MLDTSIQVIPEGNEHHGMSYLGIRLIYIWRSMLDPNIHNTKVDFKLKKGGRKEHKNSNCNLYEKNKDLILPICLVFSFNE